MLNRTFIHVPGIGAVTERKLWSRGFDSWDACLQAPEDLPLGPGARALLRDTLAESQDALKRRDSLYFSERLPSREHWRAARDFHRIGYLDIETDGTDRITVIGLYDGNRLRQYVLGDNLTQFEEEIEEFDYLATFFGSAFDLPVLRRTFRHLPLNVLHCDLCFALRRLGHRGGLKAIEHAVGIQRSTSTEGLGGWDAVRLWQEYQQGREQSLATLLEYNAADVVNLEPLLDLAYDGLSRQVFGPAGVGPAAPS